MSDAYIAVIIVNYRVADMALKAAESVLTRDHGGWSVEVHLVDNNSPGEDAAQIVNALSLAPWSDRVRFYQESVNHGFGRGNNVVLQALAARDVPPEHVLLLNPDAFVEDGAIETLATVMSETPKVGAAGAYLRPPGQPAVSSAFRFPTLAAVFDLAINLGPISKLLKGGAQALDPDRTPRGPVGWVSGASVMLRFEAARAVGFFDPAYFLYYEEVDLMRRLHVAGWEVWYVPEAKVLHVEGASTDVHAPRTERQTRPAYLFEAWRLYFVGAYGPVGALGVALAQAVGMSINLPLSRMRGQVPSMPYGYYGHLWREILWPILSGRPRFHRF